MDARLTENYLTIPTRLITDLRDNLLALALYCLVARLYLIARSPVPLSRSDILLYDCSLKTGAIKRALDRLVAEGWLVEESGHKNRYTPTWGRSRSGVVRPWQIGADYLGCPRHVFTVRLDRGIFDIYMGRLTPHPRNTAEVKRWINLPLIGLRDVGAYLLALAGQQVTGTKKLLSWGLIRDGQAQVIPDEGYVLKLVSQLQLDGASEIQLLSSGWDRLGVAVNCPDQRGQDEGQRANWQPLFFAPKVLIGHLIPSLIGHPIGCSIESEEYSNPPESQKLSAETHLENIRGNLGTTRETRDSPPNPPQPRQRGGGGNQQHSKKKDRELLPLPETESAKLLWSINAFPGSIVELADMPVGLVERAIAYAQSEPGIESIPGWVVEALRRHRDEGWPIPQPRKRANSETPIDVERYIGGEYGDLFMRGGDLSGLDDVSIKPVQTDLLVGAQGSVSNLVPPGADVVVEGGDQPDELAPANDQLGETAADDVDFTNLARLWNRVLSTIRVQTSRHEFNAWVRRTSLLSIANGVATIGTPSAFFKEGFENRYLGTVRDLISDLYIPINRVRVVVTGVGSQCANSLPSSA